MERPDKIYRTEFTVVVLSDDPMPPNSYIENVIRDMDVGDKIGDVKQGPTTEIVGDEAIVAALIEVGNDGNFFGDADAEEHDHGGASLGEDDEDADPGEESDHGGAGVNEDAEAEPDGEDEPDGEEGHLDDPKCETRLGGKLDNGELCCEHCTIIGESLKLLPLGRRYTCCRCQGEFDHPQELPTTEEGGRARHPA